MDKIITKIYEFLKDTKDLIAFEEQLRMYMYETFALLLGKVLSQLDKAIKEEKQKEGWTVEKTDEKTIQFTFGAVRFSRTLMHDENGKPHYPLDELLGIRKYQRYSSFVEVKVAELANKSDYREIARMLDEWTAVQISHATVGSIVKRVGKAQAQADREMVEELEEAASLPEGKKTDFLFAEADGVLVRATKKKKHIEVCHGIMYEGWDKNGKRVSLRNPKYIMTTQPAEGFWQEFQASAAHHYSLENTQVVGNGDGGTGYGAEKFQEAFSQSNQPVLVQLDAYHIGQAINRTFGWKKNKYKDLVKKAIKNRDLCAFTLAMDTFESTLEDEKKIEKVNEFRKYIVGHWDRIFDWRDKVENAPEDARGLGAMESNQRQISFRMKRRGMHWSKEGAEAMVKVKQGILNGTLREVYLQSQRRSKRKQREFKRTVRVSELLRQPARPSVGAKKGSVSLYTAHSSAMGQLLKALR